jgi:hypothetical protein
MISGCGARPTWVQREARGEVVLVRGDAELASWPLWVDGGVDLTVVEELARWQLSARRMGCSVRLRHACPRLVELLELVGLAGVLPARALGEVEREAEDREEGGRVEEAVVADYPVP